MAVAAQRVPSPVSWIRRVVEAHGVKTGPSCWRVPLSQQELADEEGCSAGTVQARIRHLEGCGLVLARRPLTVTFDPAVGGGPPTGHDEPVPGVGSRAPHGAANHLLAAHLALAEALRAGCSSAVLEAQALVLDELRAVFAGVAVPRPPVAEPRRAVDFPTGGREGGSPNPEPKHLPPSPPQSRPRDAEPRPAPVVADDAVVALIAPLQEMARRCGLVGLTDSRGLVEALAPFGADQIRHAVHLTSRLTEAGTVRSPLGWLVNKARQRDPDYFPACVPLSDRQGPSRPQKAEPDDPVGALAEQRVTEMEAAPHDPANAAALARLDALSAARVTAAGAISQRLVLRCDLHASRVIAWQELAAAGEMT